MWKFFEEHAYDTVDLRLAVYSGLKQFALIFAIGILAKVFVCDSLKVEGTQMEPTIMSGDRVLLFKAPYKIPFIKNVASHINKPAVITLADKSAYSILRVAAISGDTVEIVNGRFLRNGTIVEEFNYDMDTNDIIPANYSTTDFMNAMRIPAPGDSLDFRTLNIHKVISAYSIFRQETNGATLKARVLIGDSIIDNYTIRDFALYHGRIDSIPEETHGNWFFWERLQDYLYMKTADGETPPLLTFTILKNGTEVDWFKVKNHYLFLLGDNWRDAMDSRYFGPLAYSNIRGRPIITLWGFDTAGNGKRRFNGKRVGRVIHHAKK